jgi:Protein of unknown function (DUF3375)
MNLAKLLPFFETSPAVRLLRSSNAPFIVAFLDQQFKRAGRITVSFAELHAALVAYLEGLQETHPDALRDKPETYLAGWCSSDTRWLHRFLEAGRGDPVYQLTPHTEDVFAFLDHALDRDFGFVGTESRLRLVIETLDDLAVGASDDPEMRLAHLRSERQRIEREISRIESEGSVTRYQPAQIRERFATAVALLKQLQGDFRAVEDKFKQITRQVQQRQAEGHDTRGGILGFALDAEDVLKREDQGVSFYEFVRFILSPSQQERLEAIIQQLGRIQELAEQADGLETVRRMVPLLLAEAEKVMRTNQRLSATLRRLLDVRARRDRERVAELCAEILGLAASMASDAPRAAIGVDVETRVGIASPFARTFWSEPHRFIAVNLTEPEADEQRRADAFRVLAEMRRLDWRRMRERVKVAVARHGNVTLGGLLAEYPPDAGVIEALGYLQIARDDGHIFSRDAVEEIVLPCARGAGQALALAVPLVRFISL